MKFLCPYCFSREEKCIPDVVYRHAESFGGGISRFNCLHCGSVVKAYVTLKIIVHDPEKTSKGSDWPTWNTV